jgi:dipeptidyl aminopeptidase/acylaminoacyl peptidase
MKNTLLIRILMYQALRSLGVPTELVIYPGQNHGLKKPSYNIDRFNRYLDWYGKRIPPAKTTAP